MGEQDSMNEQAEMHLGKAKAEIAKGDEFYRKARAHIRLAQRNGANSSEIARYLSRSRTWVTDVLAWDGKGTLYGKDTERRQIDQAKQVLRSEPEAVADLLEDETVRVNLAAAQRVHEFRQENRTGIPRRNAPKTQTFLSTVLKVNGWLDELIGMVERGEAEIPAEFSTQSLSDIGVKAMRLKELVDDVRDTEGVLSRD
jgi:hypothetical protein